MPTFILIPGAGGSAWYWHRVEAELRQRGHDAHSVELPAADDRAGLAEYADTVVAAIGERTNVVLVAQSMCGFTAPLVCQRVPVAMIVLVNAMIPRPGETPGEWWSNTDQEQARRQNDVRAGRAPDAEFDLATYFMHDVPPALVEIAMSRPLPQSDTPFRSRLDIDAWPKIPTRVVVGRDDRFFPAEFQRRVAEERLGITPDEIPGGHLVALSNPQQVVERLVHYAADIGVSEARSR